MTRNLKAARPKLRRHRKAPGREEAWLQLLQVPAFHRQSRALVDVSNLSEHALNNYLYLYPYEFRPYDGCRDIVVLSETPTVAKPGPCCGMPIAEPQ